jgi:hypothetical protein
MKTTFPINCPSCGGSGVIPDPFPTTIRIMRTCPACEGSGVVIKTDYDNDLELPNEGETAIMKKDLIQKLCEIVIHVGLAASKPTIANVIKGLNKTMCPECKILARELQALESEDDPESDIPKHPTSYRDFTMTEKSEPLVSANFMQIRDLTDEEWLQLPKEEILQLYKNCYSMLQTYIGLRREKIQDISTITSAEYTNQKQSVVMLSDEEIKKEAVWRFTSGHGAEDTYSIDIFINAINWFKSQLHLGYPKEFVRWLYVPFNYSQPNEAIRINKNITLDELYNHWQTEIKDK